ncbi:MAG: hypothetical protein KBS85_04350 [Lachnospiraceae bacterium]|nr:hypothetical protein [Candidatus Merdinaster equi]
MNLPFFATFVLFGIWLTIVRLRVKKKDQKPTEDFWAREKAANETEAVSLDNLPFVILPKNDLPFINPQDDEELLEVETLLLTFSDGSRKTVNFTGKTNTDLKLEYGAANINQLTIYDQNYTLLARSLQKWGMLLIKRDRLDDAQRVFEYAVSIGTDVSGTYKELATMYSARKDKASLEQLLEKAESIHTPLKDSIIKNIQSTIDTI